jgi:hypothetical protein
MKHIGCIKFNKRRCMVYCLRRKHIVPVLARLGSISESPILKAVYNSAEDLYESPTVDWPSPHLHRSFLAVSSCLISIRKTADFLRHPHIVLTRAVTIGTVVCTMIVRLPDHDRLAVYALFPTCYRAGCFQEAIYSSADRDLLTVFCD